MGAILADLKFYQYNSAFHKEILFIFLSLLVT